VILGAITAVGGGTLRDTLIRRIPSVMTDGLYAIPAIIGATVAVTAILLGVAGLPAALGAAGVCFVIRLIAMHFGLIAPKPPEGRNRSKHPQPM
jgi:uncharacterized membrane protein YeiH